MGTAVLLFVLSGAVVLPFSATAALVMCVVAAALVPVAVIIGNRRERGDMWWDER